MPAHIVRARYLAYRNPAKNSDKIFNVFTIATEDGRGEPIYACVTEYGRRGRPLVRRTIYRGSSLRQADGWFDKKVRSKLMHPETPYSEAADGSASSEFAAETAAVATNAAPVLSSSPVTTTEPHSDDPRPARLLNGGQLDSLEF